MDHGFSSPSHEDAEDTTFYAELTRQILLLTDEDEEVHVKNKGVRRFNQKLVGGGGGGGQWSLMPGNYFSWSEDGEVSVPGWMERLWKANGGTGVFIPRGGVHRPRRRYNKPKKKNEKSGGHPTAGHKNLVSSS